MSSYPDMDRCSICGSRGGCSKVLDGRMCMLCLHYLRIHCEYRDFDEIELLSSASIKRIIAVTRATEEEVFGKGKTKGRSGEVSGTSQE